MTKATPDMTIPADSAHDRADHAHAPATGRLDAARAYMRDNPALAASIAGGVAVIATAAVVGSRVVRDRTRRSETRDKLDEVGFAVRASDAPSSASGA